MAWEVRLTDALKDWFENELSDEEQDAITAAGHVLADRGPSLGRPLVDNVHQSRHKNMKELIPPSGNIRILFAFDPERKAILLIGGDKTGEWNKWYGRNVPLADALYDQHLADIEKKRKGATDVQDSQVRRSHRRNRR